MSRFWRTAALGCAVIAVLGGTLLLMGNLRGSSAQSVHSEQARVEALAHLWESRLDMARSTFRDQVVRYGLMAVLDHPEEWSEWRVQTKFEAMRSTWTKEYGVPRAFALFYPDGSLHSAFGDTARLSEAFFSVRRTEGVDLAVLGRAGSQNEVLALQYYSATANPVIRPGRLIALVETSELLAPAGEVPPAWALLSAPATVLFASSAAPPASSISDAVWPLMVSQKNGMIEQPGGALLCFSRIQIPGMNPLILVYPVKPPSAAMRVMAILFVIAGTGALLIFRNRAAKPGTSSDPVPAPSPDSEPATGDAAGLRQIFQAVDEPLCVTDNTGHIIRANRKAQEYLRIQKGRPDSGLQVQTAHGEWPAAEFLARAAEDPASATGPFRIQLNGSILEGSLHASRLYRDEVGRGPVLLHFHTYFPEMHEPENPPAQVPAPRENASRFP